MAKLWDLWVDGDEFTITDPKGRSETVWLTQLSGPDHDLCVRKANAARANLLAAFKDEKSDEYLSALGAVMAVTNRELLVEYAIREELNRRRLTIEAKLELGEDSEWAKDDYLRGLQELWIEGGYKDRYAADKEDPEAARVFGELKRFNDEVTAQLEVAADQLRVQYVDASDEQLQDAVVKAFQERRASAVWLAEFERCELWRGTRLAEDHAELYFPSRDHVDKVQDPVYNQLVAKMAEIVMSPTEGKDSPAADSSSPSSGSPDASGTPPTSTQPAEA